MTDAKHKTGFTRRSFGRATVAAVAGLAAVTITPVRALARWVRGKFPVRTVEKGGWSFDPSTGNIVRRRSRKGQPKEEAYALIIDGLVDRPQSLTYAQLKALPRVEQTSDFHCVEGWSVPDVKWAGFRFSQLAGLARPKPEADYVVFHSLGQTGHKPGGLDHYVESLPLHRLTDPAQQMLMVLDMNGAPLTDDHGAPLRLAAPLDLGYKSIKYIGRVEFAAAPQPGWWTRANPIYPIEAPVPKRRLRKRS